MSEVNSYIKALMDHDLLLCSIMVKGEISNFKLHYSGHMYMTLKDEKSTIRAVMFKSAGLRLKFRPENGMKIIAEGRISVFERDGQYQLYIESMQPDGVGALHIAFEQLKKKLEAEGIFDAAKKKALPPYPQKIGVVTSPTGAAVRDIITILGRRFPCAEVLLYPVLVQGEQACYQIAEGIKYFNDNKMVDVIIVGRGGGSIEELWAFNEEVVARSIYNSCIPIVSAVGHETDFTIADFAADVRAPTPSAAAELVVPSRHELIVRINNLQDRLLNAFYNGIESRRQVLKLLVQSPAFKSPVDRIAQNRLLLDQITKDLYKNVLLNVQKKKDTFSAICSKLDILSPLGVIRRGYAIAKGSNKRIVMSVDDVSPGDPMEVEVSDGVIHCIVNRCVKGVKGG